MKALKKQQARQIFIEAAKQIVLTDGHEAITVRRVADLTGYSYPILYHYFKDLGALQWELRLNMIEDVIIELSSETTSNDPVEDLLKSFMSYTDYFFRHPNVFRFFYFHPFVKPEGNEDYIQLEQRFATMWASTFSNLIKADLLKPEDITIVAKTIIYALQGMIMLSLSSNGSLTQTQVHVELQMLVKYLFDKDHRR